MKLKPIEEIITLARSAIAGKLPTETHQSYPVPTQLGAPRVSVLYGVGVLAPKIGLTLLAPDHRGTFDVEKGELVALDAIVPADLGQGDAPHKVLGKFNMMHTARTPDAYLDAQRRLHQAYDELLPHFCEGVPGPPPDVAPSAKGFVELFKTVTEQVLWPYYEHLGKDYWEWLGRA
jgi:hypothetical protein